MYQYSEIEEHTDSILKKDNLLSIPIDVYRLASFYDIKIEERSLGEEVYGLLVVKEGKAVVGVDSDQGDQRKRFTIAHELGHFFLHRDKKSTFVDDEIFARSNKTNQFEKEANAFAASLLMPAKVVQKEIDNRELQVITESDISELAKLFNVSHPSMTYRLVNLGIIDAPFF